MNSKIQEDNNIIIRNTIVNYVRLIITSVIGLFGLRLIIIGLGLQDYGLYNVVGGIVAFMTFLNTVMVSTTYRFIAVEMGRNIKDGVNTVFNISLVVHLFMAVLVLFFTETIGVYYVQNYLFATTGKYYDAIFVLRFSTYAAFFSILSTPYQGLLTAKENFITQAIIDLIKSLLAFAAALIVYYHTGNRLRLYATLVTIASIVPAVYYYMYCRKKYSDIVKWKFQKKLYKYKEMMLYSGWTMLGAAASVGQNTGSKLLINSFFGTLTNAAFGIAGQVSGIVLTISNSLGSAALPQITKNFSRDNKEMSINLSIYVSKFTFFLMYLISIPILLETKFLLTLWLGEAPKYAVEFCQLLLLYAIINSVNSGLPTLIQATGKIKFFQIFTSAISLLSLPTAYLFFTLGSEPTVIITLTIITLVINIFITQALLRKIINFDSKAFIRRCYVPAMYVALSCIPSFLIRDYFNAGFQRFVFISVISVISFIISFYFFGIEKQHLKVLKSTVIRLFTKFR